VVLVTGTPRSGTTPVGAALSLARGVRMIYEPMGPTGDVRIPGRFAIPGQPQFPLEAFHDFLDDLRTLHLRLAPQWRPPYASMRFYQSLVRRIIGSRTRLSYMRARLSPALGTLLWKDPMAALAVPAILASGIPTVMCVRSPLAHAASYKRRRWSVDIAPVYANFRACYGPVPIIESRFAADREPTNTESAAMLWHLIYLLALRLLRGCYGSFSVPLLLVMGSELEANEIELYRRVYERLELSFEGRPRRQLEARMRRAAGREPGATKVHDWDRSIAGLNSYWKDVLGQEEVAMVAEMNSGIFQALEAMNADSAQAARIAI
jgi:hypothetical protein